MTKPFPLFLKVLMIQIFIVFLQVTILASLVIFVNKGMPISYLTTIEIARYVVSVIGGLSIGTLLYFRPISSFLERRPNIDKTANNFSTYEHQFFVETAFMVACFFGVYNLLFLLDEPPTLLRAASFCIFVGVYLVSILNVSYLHTQYLNTKVRNP